MALSVIIPDERIYLTGEDVSLKCITNQLLESSGQKSKLDITISGYALNGQTITFRFGGSEFTFTARDNYLNDGYDWPTAVGSLLLYVTLIKAALFKNYDIYRLFDIQIASSSPNYILTLQTKVPGIEFDFTIVSTSMTGIVNQAATPGAIVQYHDFHKLYIQILSGFLSTAESDVLFESAMSFDDKSETEFNFRELAINAIDDIFLFPEGSNLIVKSKHAAVLTYILAEKYGIPPVPKSALLSGSLIFVKGGVSKEFADDINDGLAIPFPVKDTQSLYQEMNFHTSQPNNKSVYYDQVEKLYITHLHEYGSVRLFFCVYSKTGQNSGSILAAENTTVYPAMSYEIVVSPYMLNLASYFNIEEIDRYEIWMENNNSEVITPVRTYILKHNNPGQRRQFIFRNSFSGFDTIMCTGVQSEYTKYERENQSVKINGLQSWQDGSEADLQIIETQRFNISTGYLSGVTLNWLRDFLLSKEIWEIGDGGKLYRSRISSAEIFWKKDDAFLYALDFEYLRAYSDEFFNVYNRMHPYLLPKPIGLSDFVFWPNAGDVLGVILEGDGNDTNFSFNGLNLQNGDRVLRLNPSTFKGYIYSYEFATHRWVMISGTSWRIRVYSKYQEKIFHRLDSNEYISAALSSSIVDQGSYFTLTGKVIENCSIKISHADTYDEIESRWNEVNPLSITITSGSFSINVSKTNLKKTLRLEIIHSLYIFDPVYLTPNYTLVLNDINKVANNGFSVTKNSASDGSVEAIVTSPGESYQLQWNNSIEVDRIDDLPAGDYSCEVVFSSGVKIKKHITLIEPSELSNHAIITNCSARAANDGAIDLNPIGGAGNFTFVWADGPTSENRTGLSAGEYQVNVTDRNGAYTQFTFNITEPV